YGFGIIYLSIHISQSLQEHRWMEICKSKVKWLDSLNLSGVEQKSISLQKLVNLDCLF
ncbi:Hypothetical predicted protein, partial [Marmota monax]